MGRRGFIERTVGALSGAVERVIAAEEIARLDRPLQRLPALLKLIVALTFLLVTSLLSDPAVVFVLFIAVLLAATVAGRDSTRLVARQIALVALVTVPIALPALVLTPGRIVLASPIGLDVTEQGARAALMLVLRVETAAITGLLLVLTTRWTDLLAALRRVGVPHLVVAIVGMAMRYLVLLSGIAREQFEARRARLVARPPAALRRRLSTSAAGALVGRSIHTAEEVHLAMVARGGRNGPRGAAGGLRGSG